jgi:hypothetical protein
MTPKQFVEGFFFEKQHLMDLYFNSNEQTAVFELIKSLDLDPERKQILKKVVDGALTDAFYTILLGLDGEAQIGNRHEAYSLQDEEGNELTGGEIENYAWEYFQNK